MQDTDWKAFGIGMVAGVALSICVYFAWSLLRPAPREPASVATVTENVPMPLDENSLIAANAERPGNELRAQPPLQLQPEPGPVAPPVLVPTPTPTPTRAPTPAPAPRRPAVKPYPGVDDSPPDDEPPPEEPPPPDDQGSR